jgi:hypothetical protein
VGFSGFADRGARATDEGNVFWRFAGLAGGWLGWFADRNVRATEGVAEARREHFSR